MPWACLFRCSIFFLQCFHRIISTLRPRHLLTVPLLCHARRRRAAVQAKWTEHHHVSSNAVACVCACIRMMLVRFTCGQQCHCLCMRMYSYDAGQVYMRAAMSLPVYAHMLVRFIVALKYFVIELLSALKIPAARLNT